ncbi:hypothetical protein B7C51_25080 (plasmid) [Paenibacillus larvae subsp. pulvifaciens]|uniref:Uncharacterized protein n=1 Tax=Paenibacillus larvae subsp. pulvifaciens TaxID=1477 RepID=A0A1V0V0B9_9BACL|nr:hypothetical protein [Paenibacillus larvae]ARF70748.1 hypothetical protein B7C51_25080 [Paenibacillus larvae subsp. pulvifaciens]
MLKKAVKAVNLQSNKLNHQSIPTMAIETIDHLKKYSEVEYTIHFGISTKETRNRVKEFQIFLNELNFETTIIWYEDKVRVQVNF